MAVSLERALMNLWEECAVPSLWQEDVDNAKKKKAKFKTKVPCASNLMTIIGEHWLCDIGT